VKASEEPFSTQVSYKMYCISCYLSYHCANTHNRLFTLHFKWSWGLC